MGYGSWVIAIEIGIGIEIGIENQAMGKRPPRFPKKLETSEVSKSKSICTRSHKVIGYGLWVIEIEIGIGIENQAKGKRPPRFPKKLETSEVSKSKSICHAHIRS